MRHVPSDEALSAKIGQLDLPDKVRLLSGATTWTTAEAPAIGLRSLTLSDGPVGVRGPVFAENRVSTNFPSSTALAASWDDDLLRRIGVALAAEARRQGVHVVLGPTINLHRSPLGGRHFECLSEDPYLSGRLATAYVLGLQGQGIGACPKHYVANDAETDRTTVDNLVDERTLRELYLAPFEIVVEDSDPWMLMAAYNGVNGAPMSENDLLEHPLKAEWGWQGAVVSDWGGVYSAVPAARAAIDLAMPGPDTPWNDALNDAVGRGEVDEADVDSKVLRLLRLAARLGRLDDDALPPDQAVSAETAGELAREAAVAGTVLLRNNGTLPLRQGALRRVALLGPGALEARPQGGGSAMVFPPYVVTPLGALRKALGDDVDITTAIGAPLRDALRPPHTDELSDTVVRWLDAEGATVAEESSATAWLYRSHRSIHAGSTQLELTTRFQAPTAGTWWMGVSGVGQFELHLDGEPVLSEQFVRDRMDMNAISAEPPQASVPVALEQGQYVDVRLRYRWAEDLFLFSSGLGVQEPRGTDDEEIARAAEIAGAADVAVVVVSTSEAVESEGFDRTSLELPGRQNELVEAVAAANPRTVVIVNAGAPVELPWRDRVAALLVSWFPGMELGNALVDVLLGNAEPGGRLPTTWPATLSTAPVTTTTPIEGVLAYDEGLHIGYRGYLRDRVQPAYWFGFGLGYTTWSFESLSATTTSAKVRLRNTGDRRGKQVVQLYVSRPDSTLDRPVITLAGFRAVEADAGATVDVDVALDQRALRHWDVQAQTWRVEAGALRVHVGSHVGDLPLQVTLDLPES